MKELAERYRGRAAFLFVCCREAHMPDPEPGQGPGPLFQGDTPARRAADADERRRVAERFRSRIEPARRLALDSFGTDSLFDRLYGGSGRDDPLLVVGTDGRVALVQDWADAEAVGRFLEGKPPRPAEDSYPAPPPGPDPVLH